MAGRAAEIDRRLELMGRDLELFYPGPYGWWEDADLATTVPDRAGATVDLAVVEGVAAATQLFVNRLKTRKGELAPLGHPEYGSRHHELIGQPNVERTRALIKLHVLEALGHEPRVEKIRRCDVAAAHDPPRNVVRIVLELVVVGEPNPRLLVVPFDLGAGFTADVALPAEGGTG
jgi:phage baseplate assembly protein W